MTFYIHSLFEIIVINFVYKVTSRCNAIKIRTIRVMTMNNIPFRSQFNWRILDGDETRQISYSVQTAEDIDKWLVKPIHTRNIQTVIRFHHSQHLAG